MKKINAKFFYRNGSQGSVHKKIPKKINKIWYNDCMWPIDQIKSYFAGKSVNSNDNGVPYTGGNIVDTNAALEARAADLIVSNGKNYTNPYLNQEYFWIQKYGDFYSNMALFQSASDPEQARWIARMISLAFIYSGLAYKKSTDTWYVVNNFTKLDTKGRPIECQCYRLSNLLSASNYIIEQDDQETLGVDDGFIWATRTHLRSGWVEFRPYLRMKASQYEKLNDVVLYSTKRHKITLGENVKQEQIDKFKEWMGAGSVFLIEFAKAGAKESNIKLAPIVDKLDTTIGQIEEMTNYIDWSDGEWSPFYGIPSNVNFKAERNVTSEIDIEQFEVEVFQLIWLNSLLELKTQMLNEKLIRDDTELVFRGRPWPF